MSDELNKEMEEVVEEESVEEATAPKANKGAVKLKQQPHDMQKVGDGPSATAPKAKGGDKSFKAEETEEEVLIETPLQDEKLDEAAEEKVGDKIKKQKDQKD